MGSTVMLFAPVFDDDAFGAAKATAEKAAALASLGFGVRVITLGARPGNVFGVSIRRITYDSISLLKALAQVASRQFVPTMVIARGTAGVSPWVIARIAGAPLIVECHSEPYDEARAVGKSHVRLAFGAWSSLWQMFLLSKADLVVFIHRVLADTLSSRVRKGRILVSGNGTDLSRFHPVERLEACRELQLDQGSLVFSFVGQVLEARGVEQLILTFNRVLESEPRSVLLIAGPIVPGYMTYLTSLASDSSRIRFLGQVSADLARTAICAGACCVLPVNEKRLSPGSPLKLFDYAACGRPIAAQEGVEGYGDRVEALRIGRAVDFFNPITAASELVDLACGFVRDEQQEQWRIRGVAEQNFGWPTIVRGWIDAL